MQALVIFDALGANIAMFDLVRALPEGDPKVGIIILTSSEDRQPLRPVIKR